MFAALKEDLVSSRMGLHGKRIVYSGEAECVDIIGGKCKVKHLPYGMMVGREENVFYFLWDTEE